MTISKERLEELRSRFLILLNQDYEEAISYYTEQFNKNPKEFLKSYYKILVNDCMEEQGLRSVQGYYIVDFPLRLKDFTEEEIKYLEFYAED